MVYECICGNKDGSPWDRTPPPPRCPVCGIRAQMRVVDLGTNHEDESERTLSAGDVVTTGNRFPMTIEGFTDSGQVMCIWFVGSKLHRKTFDATELRLCWNGSSGPSRN